MLPRLARCARGRVPSMERAHLANSLQSARWLSLSACTSQQSEPSKEGWLNKLLHVRTIEPTKTAHSSQLSDLHSVYELQIHCVKPEYMEDYLNQFTHFVELIQDKKTGATLCGSFTVEVGDQDEAIHLWKYEGGYPVLNRATEIYRTDRDFKEFRTQRNIMLRSRKSQILLRFAFWPFIPKREPKNIYDMRSYTLKPGTMIEWGNNWAQGLNCRQEGDEAVGGFFSHIGDMHTAYHFWAYKDLQTRKETRENAWRRPGWDENVAYTVPLIRHMQSRILIPTPFSPLQ